MTYTWDRLASVTYTWDRLARLATVDDAFGSRTFHYNDATTDPSLGYEELDGLVDIELERKYDTHGRDTSYEINNVTDTSRTYDTSGRFAKAKDVSPALDIATYAYASNSYDLITSVTLNGAMLTRSRPTLVSPFGQPPAVYLRSHQSLRFTATNTWESYRAVLTEMKNEIGTTIISEYGYTVNKDGQRTRVDA